MSETNIRRTDAGLRTAQEASADELLEQKASARIKEDKKAKKTGKAKESETTTATREDERIAQDMNSAIQKWDTALRGALEDLYETGQEVEVAVSGLSAAVHTLAILEEVGNFDMVLNGDDALDFIEAMEFLGLGDQVKVQSCSIVFYNDSNGTPTTSSYDTTGSTAAEIGTTIAEREESGWKIQSISITTYISPSSTNTGTAAIRVMVEDALPDAYQSTVAEISNIKNQQTKELFRVMITFSYKNSNIKAQSSLIDTLNKISQDMLRNLA